MILASWILLAFGGGFLMLMLYSSWREREWRAAAVSGASLLLFSALCTGFLVFGGNGGIAAINLFVLLLVALFLLISFIPISTSRYVVPPGDVEQFDERDHMFSRNNLKFFPHLFDRYYSKNPDKRQGDENIHRNPELGDASQTYSDPFFSPVFKASFSYLKKTRAAGRGEAASEPSNRDPAQLTRAIKEMARFYGAVDAGVTRLKKHHLYTHHGRNEERWGERVENSHTHAIVIVVAMDVSMIKKAPGLPVILESARQYVESAKIAHLVAEYLRYQGHGAVSHTDGNYQTLCVPMAVDAGMGELGRMGIFLHHIHGPCVRLSAVTCDADLIPDGERSWGIGSFCEICKKCADNCPTQSIPSGEQPSSRGFAHWSINQESCYAFWKRIGTDCGFCIRVCPYTKPNTLLHKLVRSYISRNTVNQRLALLLDDLFYGRRISSKVKNPRRPLS